MKTYGWNCIESKKWTRKGYGNQNNSNIDIIMTHLIDKDDIKIEFMRKLDISDHIPIQITLKHQNWEWKELNL